MRLSCNGCRVLRKGCSADCSIRPCIQWIKSPDSQANATVFLAKFYGRAGLINLINAGPQHLRPAVFKSLLYEACGRIVNPIYGSAGLLTSGSWQLCQAAVEAVLRGAPIMQVTPESDLSKASPPLQAGDIRHMSKAEKSSASDQLHKVKSRSRFKRSAQKPKHEVEAAAESLGGAGNNFGVSVSHESGVSQNQSPGSESGEDESNSVETVEASLAKSDERADYSDVELELTLGFGNWGVANRRERINGCDTDTYKMQLGLRISA
ncbi:LOB domain-containing protein [Quillaja saponaria]|uniref:LOB domain-containing protein n=1 Tax=Quillaja saponaria TaxID=32244 RepID=A0AAD7Q5E8_QUISA|nr:LOB domain-containing protein [Quillaja saponaria]